MDDSYIEYLKEIDTNTWKNIPKCLVETMKNVISLVLSHESRLQNVRDFMTEQYGNVNNTAARFHQMDDSMNKLMLDLTSKFTTNLKENMATVKEMNKITETQTNNISEQIYGQAEALKKSIDDGEMKRREILEKIAEMESKIIKQEEDLSSNTKTMVEETKKELTNCSGIYGENEECKTLGEYLLRMKQNFEEGLKQKSNALSDNLRTECNLLQADIVKTQKMAESFKEELKNNLKEESNQTNSKFQTSLVNTRKAIVEQLTVATSDNIEFRYKGLEIYMNKFNEEHKQFENNIKSQIEELKGMNEDIEKLKEEQTSILSTFEEQNKKLKSYKNMIENVREVFKNSDDRPGEYIREPNENTIRKTSDLDNSRISNERKHSNIKEIYDSEIRNSDSINGERTPIMDPQRNESRGQEGREVDQKENVGKQSRQRTEIKSKGRAKNESQTSHQKKDKIETEESDVVNPLLPVKNAPNEGIRSNTNNEDLKRSRQQIEERKDSNEEKPSSKSKTRRTTESGKITNEINKPIKEANTKEKISNKSNSDSPNELINKTNERGKIMSKEEDKSVSKEGSKAASKSASPNTKTEVKRSSVYERLGKNVSIPQQETPNKTVLKNELEEIEEASNANMKEDNIEKTHIENNEIDKEDLGYQNSERFDNINGRKIEDNEIEGEFVDRNMNETSPKEETKDPNEETKSPIKDDEPPRSPESQFDSPINQKFQNSEEKKQKEAKKVVVDKKFKETRILYYNIYSD